ncbi:SRPBCC domain-containing protein [Phyllobacterium sp. 628]|uniref:SRPBCC family protein n=1 Tax=Phyllobacterium sp. 628 TaxID=2718938 RepID=UPI0016626C2A|nr:SRPBCC domain-containing protein [Phyllobacterium sp. 628]QND53141.1 SRPBCC domain-containing protein [Phyllobacterium sp. 628]
MTSEKPDTGKELRYEYDLDAAPAKVWRALTVPEFVARWLLPEPQAPQEPPRISLKMLEADTERFVRYSMREEDDAVADSIVTFRLNPNGNGGTTFSILHEPVLLVQSQGRTPANGNAPPLTMHLAA